MADVPEKRAPSWRIYRRSATISCSCGSDAVAAGGIRAVIAVYFKNANILDLGDLIQSDIFPFCDNDHGGNLVTLSENIDKIIDATPANVRIIPTHGREYTLADLK